MHLPKIACKFPCFLSQIERQKLNDWAEKIKGISLFEIHGFLCAILTCPTIISPTQWLPILLGPNLSEIVSDEEMSTYRDMVMQLKEEVAHHLIHDEVFYPLVNLYFEGAELFFEDDNLSTIQLEHLHLWCQGYLSEMKLEPTSWEMLPEYKNLLFVLRALKQPNPSPASLGIAPGTELTPAQIQRMISHFVEGLPVALSIAYDQACAISKEPKENKKLRKTSIHRLFTEESAKKYTPCPCNSGMPFAQCCGIERGMVH